MDVQPVDGDPFTGASLQPVNGDPFTAGAVTPDSQGQAGSFLDKLGTTWPARMAVGAYDAMMAPGDYMQGKISTEEAERQAFNAAGLVMSGGVLSGVERAAGEAILGSGPIRGIKTVPVEGDPFQPITAYHGSPHDFDAFDISKIGTGEGAQAYGHGLYFAGNEGVARQYKEALGGTTVVSGTPVQNLIAGNYVSGTPQTALQIIQMNNGKAADSIAYAKDLVAQGKQPAELLDHVNEYLKDIQPATGGHMYQVQINANPDHFLDWDKPLSEQHPVVQSGVQKLANDIGYMPPEKPMTWGEQKQQYLNPMSSILQGTDVGRLFRPEDHFTPAKLDIPAIREYLQQNYPEKLAPYDEIRSKFDQAIHGNLGDMQGGDIHEALSDALPQDHGDVFRGAAGKPLNRDMHITQKLQQAGIPGIKYLDAGSRGSGAGTSNYVVFNHDIIDIIKKYGIGGLGIGTAAGIKHFQTQPVNNDPYSNQNPGGVI